VHCTIIFIFLVNNLDFFGFNTHGLLSFFQEELWSVVTTAPPACFGSLQELEGREGKGREKDSSSSSSMEAIFGGVDYSGPGRLTWNCLREEPAWFLNNLPLFSQLQWGVIFGVRRLSFFWSLFFFFFTISHHDSLVYVMREICWQKKKLLRDRREKAVVPCINHLANSCWEKVLKKTCSALVSGRWYYCKNVTSGLLAEESQRRRSRRKIADQLENVGRQIGKDFATCNKNREVLLAVVTFRRRIVGRGEGEGKRISQ
jgi:hypothetical protein